MPKKSAIINENLINKCHIALKIQGKSGKVARRLQAIISSKDHNISVVSSVFGITRATLTKWIKDFEKESISGLLVKSGRGRKKIFNHQNDQEIRNIIKNNPNITAKSLQKIIDNKLNIKVGIATIYRLMHRLGFSYITPRKNHYKQDKNEVDIFKKNSK